MNKNKLTKRKIALITALFLSLVAGGIGFAGYQTIYEINFDNTERVYIDIDDETDFEKLTQQLQDSAHCMRINSFIRLAHFLDYPEAIKTGRYALAPQQNNLQVLRMLRSGSHVPVKLTFNNIRTNQDLAERLAPELMLSVDDLLVRLEDSVLCASYGFTPETIKCMFIPNTYEVYWNISPDNLFKRMKKEHTVFWSPNRLRKAEKIGLTPAEVAVLASIVEEETAAAEELPIVAGLYINRLHRKIPLQADPTVKFAVGDFTLQRILFEHLKVESPYNTYIHLGLPPGPLRIPSIRGMDAVLNYTHHKYLYMCAKEDLSGRHNFARTLGEHGRNARRYRAELNRRKIR